MTEATTDENNLPKNPIFTKDKYRVMLRMGDKGNWYYSIEERYVMFGLIKYWDCQDQWDEGYSTKEKAIEYIEHLINKNQKKIEVKKYKKLGY